MSNHRIPIRCRVTPCPVIGYFDPENPLCPLHSDEPAPPRLPTLAQTWREAE